MGRHLVASATVGHADLEGAETPGRARGVHRDVAASDDHDASARQLGGLVDPHLPEEVQPGEHAVGVLTRHAEGGRARGPGGEQHGVVALGLEGLEVADGRAGDDLDTEGRDVGDVLLDDLLRESVRGERMPEEAARLGLGLVDADLVAEPRELPRRREAGRTGSDDRDALAVGDRAFDAGAVHLGVVAIGGEPLEPTDRDRRLEVAARALRLAGGVARAPQRADQRGGVEDELERVLVLPAADQGHVTVGLDAGGAVVDAR
ncbi:hypothetical protein GALL_345650 [mine drainage metagenome]|uniref:Uncharacterized protein n=1 Tax=mine drainage metagenome TaxID=410659 RepID=A0A1J5QK23_9ZZZZ